MDLEEIRRYRLETRTGTRSTETCRQEEEVDSEIEVRCRNNYKKTTNNDTTTLLPNKNPESMRRRQTKPEQPKKKKIAVVTRRSSTTLQEIKDVVGDSLTNSRLFEYIVDNIFERCDTDKNGDLDKEELYSAILLIHLKLAKHVGPAACSPPSRKTVIRLFHASDIDNSGGIDRQEFNSIAKICCAQIMGRIATYWCCMVFMVPLVAQYAASQYSLGDGTWQQKVLDKTFTILFMAILLPMFWDIVDHYMEQHALTKKQEEQEEMSRSMKKQN